MVHEVHRQPEAACLIADSLSLLFWQSSLLFAAAEVSFEIIDEHGNRCIELVKFIKMFKVVLQVYRQRKITS